ncbi:hypothetical protein MPDQ_002131 [Monascus purpureus]|uniref:DUF7907 domain-containing protein n=1 Tax=Monascus purpureus TaxID=5098 RepID=A0A507QQ83_MONPU|nr:hypothetical protein MPDQ_002131 [Monascus purpureus]BDD58224.1 hypothetical protein MAP00_003519 [Monascus purpureus]
MKFLSIFSLFIASVVVTANPIAPRDADSAKTFRLKTSQANLPNHNNLYVYAYHTGAGLNDAVLTSDAGTASPAILNDTTVQFELGTSFPWGLILEGDTNYAAWELVEINAGAGVPGFSINGSGLVWNGSGFGGWLVCDWYHNAAQLFWLNYYYSPVIPSSCSKANLDVEYTS